MRFTGPLVTRVEDLSAIPPEAPRDSGDDAGPAGIIALSPRGTVEVNGRQGRAYYLSADNGWASEEPMAVIARTRCSPI